MDIRTSLLLLSLGGAALTGCVSIGASSRPPVKTPAPRLILQELPRETGVPLTVQASVMGLTHCVLTVTATGGSRGSTTLFHGADTDGPHSAARTANDAVLVIVPSDTRQLKGVAVCRYERNKVTHRVHLTAGISV